jgi:threonine-phosphate decarboxylase
MAERIESKRSGCKVTGSIEMNGHGGNRRAASKKYGIPEGEILDFSSNINPLGLHPSIEKLINANQDSLLYYPDPEYEELKTALSRHYGIDKEHILPGNGSAELIYLLAQTLQPRQVLIPEPNFSEYEHSLAHTSSQITCLHGEEESLFKVPGDTIISHLQGHRVLYLSTPNNPIGYTYSRKELLPVLQACEKNQCYLLVDEAFIHFSKDGARNTMTAFIPEYRYLMVLHSFTKIFAVPGLRLGIIFANKEMIRQMASRQIPWSVNCFAQKIGASIIKETQYIKQSIDFVYKQREFLAGELARITGLHPFPSEANYMVCKLTGKQKLASLEDHLGKNRIMIRNCSDYHGLNAQYFRIAVRKAEENKQLIESLKEFAGSR